MITAMSAQSELYNVNPANLPLPSLEQLQALHDYNEKSIKAEAQADLYFMTRDPVLFFTEFPSATSLDGVERTGTPWDSRNERDDEITRALCEDQRDKNARWEKSYEQWSTVQEPAETTAGAGEEHSSNSLYLDTCLQGTETAVLRYHNRQLQAMSALLHLQDREHQCRQDSSIKTNIGDRAPARQGQVRLERSISPKSQLPTDQHLLHAGDETNLYHSGGPVKQSITRVSGILTPRDTPLQSSQANLSLDETLEETGTFKVNLPSVSLLPHPDNGYDHPQIHFPSLSYVVEGITNNVDNKYHDSVPEHNTSQSQNFTSYTPLDSPFLTTSTSDTLPTNPSPSSLTHRPEESSSQVSKNLKKGTEPKKPYVPTRRWSRTHLNQLMRKHRPRNLPEGIDVTDDVEVQDVPIELLTHEYCEVKAEKEGETVYIGAGTRVDVSPDDGDASAINGDGGVLDSIEAQPVVKRTPFRMMIMDHQGNVKVDMSWYADVAVDEPVHTTFQVETCDDIAQQDIKYW